MTPARNADDNEYSNIVLFRSFSTGFCELTFARWLRINPPFFFRILAPGPLPEWLKATFGIVYGLQSVSF